MSRRPMFCFASILIGMLSLIGPAMPVMAAADDSTRPSVLLIVRAQGSGADVDYHYLQQLHAEGFDLDVWIVRSGSVDRELTWDLVSQYNVLVIENLPPSEHREIGRHYGWGGSETLEQVQLVLDRYVAHGGGIIFLPDIHTYEDAVDQILTFQSYLEPWGAKLAVDSIHDPKTTHRYVRNGRDYIFTSDISPSPVSEGVNGLWLPVGPDSNSFYHQSTSPLEFTDHWQVVVRGGPDSYTQPRDVTRPKGRSANREPQWAYHRDDPMTPPALMGIRETDGGRLALAAVWHNFHLGGGTRWVHDSVVLKKGLNDKPSDFHQLFVNTLRWLSEPSLQRGTLGGYQQDPLVLVHPHHRREPQDFFPDFDQAQNLAPGGDVYQGLIGARTSYSTGSGTVREYAEVASRAGLDFVIFLDELHALTEDKLKALADECLDYSSNDLVLLPGYSFESNIGDRMFVYGHDLKWPALNQLETDAEGRPVFRLQNFDENRELTTMAGPAKALLWHHMRGNRNVGYYHFRHQPGVPTRSLRMFGMFGVVTYIDGQQVEDAADAFRRFTYSGNPPLAGGIHLMHSPEALMHAAKHKQAMTFAVGRRRSDLPELLRHGHQYGRPNVYLSEGPAILSWAGTRRVMTYAGEPFVTTRARVRPLCWVTSDAGLREVAIYRGEQLIRRIALHGEREFRHTFEWSYDRQQVLTLEVTDIEGRRAISTGLEIWDDANMNMWMSDRQNVQGGEMWHGPASFRNEGAARAPRFSQGPTWDGGGHESFIGWGIDAHPQLRVIGQAQAQERAMDALQRPTYFGASDVANLKGVLDREYAPGRAINAYHTFGPTEVSDLVHYRIWRTQYQHRRVGPAMDSHAMWAERTGGNLAILAGQAEFQRDLEVDRLRVGRLLLRGITEAGHGNRPYYAIRHNDESEPTLIAPGENAGRWHIIEPGGYIAMFATELGNNSMLFNIGNRPLRLSMGSHWWLEAVVDQPAKAGETVDWSYLVVYDGMDTCETGVARAERIRSYLGVDGRNGSGIQVTQGSLRSHRGAITLEAHNGAIAFNVPHPGFELNVPVGLRFVGLNPNWTVGQWQQEGYTTGYYTDGRDVYRNIGLDDDGIGYLAVYPDHTAASRHVVGHPIIADDPALVIQVTPLRSDPYQYYVAVNNPTNQPIQTTLRKAINLPGLAFNTQDITVAPGELRVVLDPRPLDDQQADDVGNE